MRLPPRGVCRLCLGGILVKKQETPVFCEVFVNNTTFRVFVFPCFLFLVFGSILAKVSQIPCFSCFAIVQFWGQLRSFCLESRKNSRFLHGRRLESQATSILKGPPKRVRHTAPQPSRRRSPKEKENTSRSRMDVITPPPPPSPPKPPHRVQK